MFVPLAIFLLSYVLIASRRVSWLPIGRTAGALLGAVWMVVCQARHGACCPGGRCAV